MKRALQLHSEGLPNAKKECMTMEKPSTCRKENTASLRSDASTLEKTLAVTQLYDEFRPRIYSHNYRLLGNQQDADDVIEEDDPFRTSHSGGILEIAEREHIQRTFAHLPKGYALPLLLNAAKGISYQEIALIVGISPRAAATRLTRARKLFAEEYQRLGSDVIS